MKLIIKYVMKQIIIDNLKKDLINMTIDKIY